MLWNILVFFCIISMSFEKILGIPGSFCLELVELIKIAKFERIIILEIDF